jgi:hypothetical protein
MSKLKAILGISTDLWRDPYKGYYLDVKIGQNDNKQYRLESWDAKGAKKEAYKILSRILPKSNPSKGKFVSCSAVRFNSNGSVSIKK